MKLKHILRTLLLGGVLCAAATACDSDLDRVLLGPQVQITLGGGTGEIILSPDTPDALALTIYWSGDGRLALSDTLLQAPVNAADIAVELSKNADFAAPTVLNVDRSARYLQLRSGELNNILGRMGYEGNEVEPLYIRVRSTLAPNQPVQYSNVLTVKVKNFVVHLNIAAVLNKDGGESAMTLGSATENGIYTGFMGVGGWFNWWLKEANGVTWGNLGVDGKAFFADSESDHWNFWFPEPAGCYYTTVNTIEGWWSALYISELTLGGDLSGAMTYNRTANQWTVELDGKKSGNVTVKISGKGSLYDKTTGTDNAAAVAKTVAFGGSADALTFGDQAAGITLNLPAGTKALVLDLSNPLKWTLAPGEVKAEPTVAQRMYLSGVFNWDFNDYLTLYDEEGQKYGAAHQVKSEWGYRLYPTADWSPAYRAGDNSTATAGTLVLATGDKDGNIPAPAEGLYVMDFDMKALTYALTAVKSVSMTGMNDDWNLTAMKQDAANPEVWSCDFTKTKDTPWGVKVLINGDWALFFGNGNGEGNLRLGHSDAVTGFDGNKGLTVGKTYTLTVDLGKCTYTYKAK